MRIRGLRRSSIMIATAFALSALGARSAHAAGVEPAKATPVQREQAQSRFLKGRELYNQKKYEAALTEMNASLDIVASPNTRLYVGRCLRELGRIVAAYAELGRAAVEANELRRDDTRYEKAAQAANDERAALAPKLGFLDVRVTHATPETTLKVANDEVRRGGWEEPVPVLPGTATVLVETPGRPPVQQQIDIAAGEHKSVAVDAVPEAPADAVATTTTDTEPSDSATKLRPVMYVTAGLAVVGLATFAIAGIKANGTYSDLKSACGAGPCPPGHESDISAGKTQQTFANVGLVVFVVSAAATATLFFVTKPKPSSPTAASARVTAGPSFVGLQGAF